MACAYVQVFFCQYHRTSMRGTFPALKTYPAPLQAHVAAVRDSVVWMRLRLQQEAQVVLQAVLFGVLHLGLEDFHLVGLADEAEFAVLEE